MYVCINRPHMLLKLLAIYCMLAAGVSTLPLSPSVQLDATDVVYLAADASIDVSKKLFGANVLRIYCYAGKSISLLSLFESIEFQLAIRSDDYTEYDGRTPEEVVMHYNEQRSLFSFTLLSQKRQLIQLSPFEQQCIGIASRQPYNVSLAQTRFDWNRFVQLAASVALFWYAERLAKNSVFYYLAGVVLGICASLLVIIALASKLLPRRPMMYGMLIGGWAVGFYMLKLLADNIRLIFVTYREYLLWYLAITGLLSFLICYRIGPPRNARSQNIVMWVLQAIAFCLAYMSTWHVSFAAIIMVLTCLIYYFPHSLLTYIRKYYHRRFPTKRRLLTQEECYNQSMEATARSLSELRAYVNSPNCRQWNMMNRLQNPQRFASFADGAPHLYDEEILNYSRTIDDSLESAEGHDDLRNCTMHYLPPQMREARRSTQSTHSTNSTPRNSMPHDYEQSDSESDSDSEHYEE